MHDGTDTLATGDAKDVLPAACAAHHEPERTQLGSVERRSTITVVTQNILGAAPFWSARCRRLAEQLRTLNPDVIGLQEVKSGDASDCATQAHELAAMLGGYDVDFARAQTSARGVGEGVALLHKRHGVIERSVQALTLDARDRMDRRSPRVVLSALLDVRGVPMHVFVTHLSLSRNARTRTIAELAQTVSTARSRTPAPATVILGDFNAPPGEQALRRLVGTSAESWTDAWVDRHSARRGPTWPTPLPLRRIDYVFVQLAGGFHVEQCERLMHAGSDHCAVWVRLASEAQGAVCDEAQTSKASRR